MPKYGFIPPTQDDRDYQLGAVSKVINPAGNWLAYTPLGETQSLKVDPNTCTCYALLNCIEILENFQHKLSENYSERGLAIPAGVRPPGADPKKVMDFARKFGFISEEYLPFSSEIETLEEYFSPDPLPQRLKNIASKWLFKRSFSYELVFAPWIQTNKPRAILEAIKRSPLSVSGYAWVKEGNFYVKPQAVRDNHNFVLIDAVENEYFLAWDSYPDGTSYLKKLAWNYDFGFCWAITLGEPKPISKGLWYYVKVLVEKIINLFR